MVIITVPYTADSLLTTFIATHLCWPFKCFSILMSFLSCTYMLPYIQSYSKMSQFRAKPTFTLNKLSCKHFLGFFFFFFFCYHRCRHHFHDNAAWTRHGRRSLCLLIGQKWKWSKAHSLSHTRSSEPTRFTVRSPVMQQVERSRGGPGG